MTVKRILLLDFDHTLYPPSANTLKAVDARINLYIQTYLGFSLDAADGIRLRLWDEYGTTLRGLEIHHGVDRDHYCDFIHAIDAIHLPPPDPALRDWLARLSLPFYIFTNARRDWAERGLAAMGLSGILPVTEAPAAALKAAGAPRLHGILDIAFMGWEGKPHPLAYDKVDKHLRAAHGENILVILADDRTDNLLEARRREWMTIWISPEAGRSGASGEFDWAAASLTELDPDKLG